MIRSSRGNAAKDTKRCPVCGTENVIALWERVPKSETRVAHTCLTCGHWIILDHAGWETFWGDTPPSF